MFFVGLLRRDPDDPLPSQITDDEQSPPLLDGKDPFFIVEKILRAETFRGIRLVCDKWIGYKETTWEPRENLVLTDAFKKFVTLYVNEDNVEEPNTGSYSRSLGKQYM